MNRRSTRTNVSEEVRDIWDRTCTQTMHPAVEEFTRRRVWRVIGTPLFTLLARTGDEI